MVINVLRVSPMAMKVRDYFTRGLTCRRNSGLTDISFNAY